MFVESDGRRYAGEWTSGMWHGQGTWENPLLGRYSGSWRHGVFHGRGVFRWAEDQHQLDGAGRRETREAFDGEFDQGCPCVGVLTMKSGSKFDVAYNGLTSILDFSITPVSKTPFKVGLAMPSCCGLNVGW